MKFLKAAVLVFTGLFFLATGAKAQAISDPTTWTYEVKKKSATEYELVFHVKLEKTWHIWSVKPGGDGFQVVPSFVLDKNPNVKLKGSVKEMGKKTTEKMDGIDGAVSFYSNKVDYVLTVTVKGPTKITGKHEYQVCNNMMCMPPKKKSFVFEIKS
jgi:hypothetical protein